MKPALLGLVWFRYKWINVRSQNFIMKLFIFLLIVHIAVSKVNGTEIKCGSLLGSTQFASSGTGRSHSAPWAVSIGEHKFTK